MTVRRANVDDAPGIAFVHMSTWLTTYRGIVADEFLDSLKLEEFVSRIRGHLSQRANYFVAEADGEILGFAAGNRTRDEELRTKFDAEVYAIYVLKEYQSRGAGRLLIEAVLNSFSELGFGSTCVWVLKDNRSRGFYERLGGKYVMEKPLNFGGKTLIEVAYGWDAESARRLAAGAPK